MGLSAGGIVEKITVGRHLVGTRTAVSAMMTDVGEAGGLHHPMMRCNRSYMMVLSMLKCRSTTWFGEGAINKIFRSWRLRYLWAVGASAVSAY